MNDKNVSRFWDNYTNKTKTYSVNKLRYVGMRAMLNAI